MTLDDALAELGIDRSAGSEGARRAYLRLLKTRKPETDPAGFMRLREAYELVKSSFAFWEPVMPAEMVQISLPARFEPPPKVAEVAPPKAAEVAPPKAEVVIEAGPEVPEDDIIDIGRLSRRQAGREETPAEEGVDAVNKSGADEDANARADDEDEDEGEDEHEDEHDEEDEDEEDDAEGRDLPPREEPARAEVVPDARSIDDLMRARAYDEAAAAMATVFRVASTRLFETPPLREALRMMLTLPSTGALAAAATVRQSFASWLAATGQEARLLRGELTVLWTLVRELDSLPSSLPAPVRGAIARAALSGDLAHAKGDLASFRFQRRSEAATAGNLLRRSAPTIAAALADTIDPPPPPLPQRAPSTSGSGSRSGAWVIMVVLIGLVRIIAGIGSSSSPSYYTPPPLNLPKYTFPTTLPIFGLDGGLVLPSRLEQLRITALSRASTVEDEAAASYPYIAKKAREVHVAIESQNCATARVASKVLHDMTKKNATKAGGELLNTEVLLLDMGVHDYCAELGDAGVAEAPLRDGGKKQQP